MKYVICTVFLLFTIREMVAQSTAAPSMFDINAAERFANLALACVHKEYPNHISHPLNSDADVAPPRKLTPAFFSPCLGEADLMRRVLPSAEFGRWLQTFLPQISPARKSAWLQPVVSPDPSDPKLAHLDGLNLSRAWMLEGIAAGLPKRDKRVPTIMATAEEHRRAGLAAVTGEHYEGGHWLGSFAVYLVTKCGIALK
jgi:hypothetical protein